MILAVVLAYNTAHPPKRVYRPFFTAMELPPGRRRQARRPAAPARESTRGARTEAKCRYAVAYAVGGSGRERARTTVVMGAPLEVVNAIVWPGCTPGGHVTFIMAAAGATAREGWGVTSAGASVTCAGALFRSAPVTGGTS